MFERILKFHNAQASFKSMLGQSSKEYFKNYVYRSCSSKVQKYARSRSMLRKVTQAFEIEEVLSLLLEQAKALCSSKVKTKAINTFY